MDFRNRSYYLIGRDYKDADIPKRLKKYFKCKIHCHHYYYDDDVYTHCVSVSNHDAKRLVSYLKDYNIKYQQVNKQMERISYWKFKYTSEEKRKERERRKAEYDKKITQFKEIEESLRINMLEMLAHTLNITDMDVVEVRVFGYDVYGHHVEEVIHNQDFIMKLEDMCREIQKEIR